MLRDAIWALLGMGDGSLFCVMEELEKPGVGERLHPAEQGLCKRISDIARSYMAIRDYIALVVKRPSRLCRGHTSTISEEANCSATTKKDPPAGFYVLALCEEMSVLLKPYCRDISKLEEKAVETPGSVTLTEVYLRAEKYAHLFHVLNHILEQVEVKKIRGCALLNLLYANQRSGIGEVTSAIKSLIHKLQVLMVNQLSKWLLYGTLEDTHKEFFIQKSECNQENTAQVDEIQVDIMLKSHLKGLDWTSHLQYKVEPLMLPNYIKHSVASEILYIGKMVRIFGSNPQVAKNLGNTEKENVYTLWASKQTEYFYEFQSLQTCKPGRLNIMWLRAIIKKIRADVMKHLWQLIKEDAKLVEEVELMKDIFMLGRGELFQELIVKTESLRRQPYSKATNRDMQAAFKVAVHKVLPNDETIAEKFQFRCELPEGSDEDVFKDKGGWWHFMSIKYTVQWPLQLVFKPVLLDNYNIIFKFLFRLKNTVLDVQSIWHAQMKSKRCFGLGNRPSKFWQLQHNLMYLLNNIQYYMQVCVLEPQYRTLKTRIEKCTDIEEIVQAHINFQANIMSHFFLTMREVPERKLDDEEEYVVPFPQKNPVYMSIMLILQVSEKFCKTAKLFGNELTGSDVTKLDVIFNEFQHSLAFFMNLLTCAQDHQLFQLCVMLEFNEQFSFRIGSWMDK